MTRYSKKHIEALTNWDGMLSKKPFRNAGEEKQYYSRFLQERLWKYLSKKDWGRIHGLIDSMKIPEKTKNATRFLLRLKKIH